HQQRFYLTSWPLLDQSLEERETESRSERLGAHRLKCGDMVGVVDRHHPANLARAGEGKPPSILENELDASVNRALVLPFVIIQIAAHPKMEDESAAVVQGDNQILAPSGCLDKASSFQPASEGSGCGALDHDWGGNDYAFDALAERGAPEIE